MATILDGKKLSETINNEIAAEVKKLADSSKPVPGLAVIIVGNNPASKVYVASKKKACATTGIFSLEVALDENITQNKLLEEINKWRRLQPQRITSSATYSGFLPINIIAGAE